MISIIIPLYNKAHTIINTLNSVLQQVYKDFEVIVINDGSTDGSTDVIKQNFIDPRIKIIDQNNKGVSEARNRGVDEASNEHIAFLDGDDEWHPEYLLIMVDIINKNPGCGMFLCAGIIQGNDNTITYRIAQGYENYCGEINLFQNPAVFSHTSATIIKKSIFNKTHRFMPGMCKFEDYLLSQTIALIAPVYYCGIPLTKYNGDVQGQLTQRNKHDLNATKSMLLYYNMIIANSLAVNRHGNKFLNIYLRYDLFHTFKQMLKKRHKQSFISFLQNLSPQTKSLFAKNELALMTHCPRISVFYINLTKIFWRMHRFPVIGGKLDLRKIESKYLNW